MPEHHAHHTGTRGDYNGVIAQLAGVDRLSPLYDKLLISCLRKGSITSWITQKTIIRLTLTEHGQVDCFRAGGRANSDVQPLTLLYTKVPVLLRNCALFTYSGTSI